MRINLQGRVENNTYLPFTRPLLPLFEAVVNSLQAITESGRADGEIVVRVHRDKSQPDMIGARQRQILGFTVEDNGCGFNSTNYDAFETTDSDHKRAQGGKGVGRLLWLKAFNEVKVQSRFIENGKAFQRSFTFTVADGVSKHQPTETDSTLGTGTTILLNGFLPRYESECPRRPTTIAERLIEHCVFHFLRPGCPAIMLRDEDAEEPIDVNKVFAETIGKTTAPTSFRVGENEFHIRHVRLYGAEQTTHSVQLCANERPVLGVPIKTRIPALNQKLKDSAGNSFVYLGYVNGAYLDSRGNSERTDISFSKAEESLLPGEVTEEQMNGSVVERVKEFLADSLTAVEEGLRVRVEKIVRTQMPHLRRLLKRLDGYLGELSPTVSEDDLKLWLNKVQFLEEQRTLGEGRELEAKRPDNATQQTEYRIACERYLERLEDSANARLAQYIVHRKAIIDLLAAKLALKVNGEFGLEDDVHRIIFPMKTTSDEVAYEDHNLWLIDERLAYHYHLASDVPLTSNPNVASGSLKRPDILIFERPEAFIDSDEPIPAVVIIEFKAPGRTDYRKETPVEQVWGYIDEIRSGKARRKTGRPLKVDAATPFFCYVICDLEDEIHRTARNAGLIKTPDGEGYFGYNPNYSAYIEIISFDKLVRDAKKRNRVLFDKLGLM